MAQANFDPATNTITIVVTETEKAILQRAIQEHGVASVKNLLESWFADRDQHQIREDMQVFFQKFQALPPYTKQQIRVLLG